jgi:hypothetical protein
MRRAGRAVSGLGWRGMLALVGGVASLAGLGTSACGTTPVYGVRGDGGWVDCATNADCEAKHGTGWYCPPSGHCTRVPVDAGTPDAGN